MPSRPKVPTMTGHSESNDFSPAEVLRANWVIEKAVRDELNVVETLVSHMVSPRLIEALTGKTPLKPKSAKVDKQAELKAWVQEHLGQEMKTAEIAEGLGVSLSTVSGLVKDKLDFFIKVRRGIYLIRDGEAERSLAKSRKST